MQHERDEAWRQITKPGLASPSSQLFVPSHWQKYFSTGRHWHLYLRSSEKEGCFRTDLNFCKKLILRVMEEFKQTRRSVRRRKGGICSNLCNSFTYLTMQIRCVEVATEMHVIWMLCVCAFVVLCLFACLCIIAFDCFNLMKWLKG